MLILELTTGKRHIEILRHRVALPKFRRANFKGLIVRDMTLEVVRAKFKNLPDLPEDSEVYYPGELGLFVLENLFRYLRNDKTKRNGK